MGESQRVTKGEVHDLAREFGEKLGEVAAQVRDEDARLHSLAVAFDVLVAVLGSERVEYAGATLRDRIKAELERRKADMEAKNVGSSPG